MWPSAPSGLPICSASEMRPEYMDGPGGDSGMATHTYNLRRLPLLTGQARDGPGAAGPCHRLWPQRRRERREEEMEGREGCQP